jgi:hypothetical protein
MNDMDGIDEQRHAKILSPLRGLGLCDDLLTARLKSWATSFRLLGRLWTEWT